MTDAQIVQELQAAYNRYALSVDTVENARQRLVVEVGKLIAATQARQRMQWDRKPGDSDTLWDEVEEVG